MTFSVEGLRGEGVLGDEVASGVGVFMTDSSTLVGINARLALGCGVN
jgi:hypothetical protein